jgi:catechol 2,3-dioxygenase-like lactoylglutathione lyase family enzyme
MNAPFGQQITFLPVAKLAVSSRFYRDVLGLELVLDQGDCHIYQTTKTSFVGLCERSEVSVEPRLMVCLTTNDVDGMHAKLVEAGARCTIAPRHNTDYKIYQAMFEDPDGYTIEIQQFLDPDWPASDTP